MEEVKYEDSEVSKTMSILLDAFSLNNVHPLVAISAMTNLTINLLKTKENIGGFVSQINKFFDNYKEPTETT